jgi:hypothetical protein
VPPLAATLSLQRELSQNLCEGSPVTCRGVPFLVGVAGHVEFLGPWFGLVLPGFGLTSGGVVRGRAWFAARWPADSASLEVERGGRHVVGRPPPCWGRRQCGVSGGVSGEIGMPPQYPVKVLPP